ncbi:hypothetical protein J6O48_05480 [bacterium]|nr:hypothetical protein [bacterium]
MDNLNLVNRIILQSPKRFEETVKGFKEVSKFPNYSIKDSVASYKDKYTRSANSCAELAMSNGKYTYLGHFAPELRKYDFRDKLDYIIKKMQDETGELSAFVTGGHDVGTGGNKFAADESFRQLADIGNVLDNNNVENLTMIAAKKKFDIKDNLAVTGDSFIFSHTPTDCRFNPLQIDKPNPTREELEALLKTRYGIVEIAPEHTIEYIG